MVKAAPTVVDMDLVPPRAGVPELSPRRGAGPPGATAAATVTIVGTLVIVGILVALAIVLTRGTGNATLVLATALGGLLALATAVHLLVSAFRSGPECPSILVGAATAAWGIGQLVMAHQLLDDAPIEYPTIGTRFSMIAAAVALTGLLIAARGSTRGTGLLRLGLEALLLGASGALVAWRLAFVDGPLAPAGSGQAGRTMILAVLVELVILALLLLLWLRDLDHVLLLAVAGLAVFVAADLVVVHGLLFGDGRWPWQAVVLRALAWPIMWVAVLGFGARMKRRRSHPSSLDDSLREADVRVTVVTTVSTIGLLIIAVVTVVGDASIDPVTVKFALLVLVLFGCHEIANGLQRRSMLGGLTLLAFHDPLTGLGNRRALTRRLDRLAPGGRASVLTLDLDGFKEVNDILGHASGDALLVAVAASVRRCAPPDVEAFRIGGDEFAVVVPGDTHRAHVLAEQLLVAVRQAADVVPGADAVQVSASVGVAMLGPDVLTVLVESGVALRAAKSAGRDRVEMYDGPVAAQHRRRLLVERRLRDAIVAGDVVPHYQPVVDLRTCRVVGVEALARWHDDVLGRVGPDEFIPVAENSSLIAAVGGCILRRAVADMVDLQPTLGGAVRLGVNASVAQVRRPGYAESVLAVVEEFRLPPGQLIIEVTESLFVDDDDPALRELRMLRSAGVHVAIDDFGSGFSSLAYLARMPADILKLDRAMTAQVLDDRRARAVLDSIITLATSLPMDVVVEGVETLAVHRLVRDAGGGFGQGWLYGAAVPAAEVAALVAEINAKALLSLPQ